MTWHPITESVPQHKQKVRCKLVFPVTGGEYVLPEHYYYNAHNQLFMLPSGQTGYDLGHISISEWTDANELEAASKAVEQERSE